MSVDRIMRSTSICKVNSTTKIQSRNRAQLRPLTRADLQRAEKVLLFALESMENRVLDVTWFNTRDLRPENLFRDDRVSQVVVADLAETLRYEFQEAAA